MKIFATLAFTLLSVFAIAQSETETLKKAKAFIEDKKYESAFVLLNKFDPENSRPEIVLLKEEILLNYFVSSIMHQMFALTDIKKNEDILDYRGKEGSYSMHMFSADSILDRLIKKYPENCKLYKGLGDYYYNVLRKYDGNWLMEEAELLTLLQTNFQKAIDGGCADYLSYYAVGYVNSVQEKVKEGIPYLLKSTELNKSYGASHYNLAYSYLLTEDKENALKYAKLAIDLYTDPEYKGDAARLAGQVYAELNDVSNAMAYNEMAYKIDPANFYNITALLGSYVKADHQRTGEITKALFDHGPDNPGVHNSLEEIYSANKKENELIDFYKTQLPLNNEKTSVQAALYFFLGRLHTASDKKLAKDYFLKSRVSFEKIFESDHPVFGAINDALKQIEE